MNQRAMTRASTMYLPIVLSTGLGGCHHDASAAAVKEAAPRVHVESVSVAERALPKVLPLTGTIAADRRTDLAANANGRVVRTFVERGQHVERGQILAQLDVRSAATGVAEAEANIASATASRENAVADCARYVELQKRGAITTQELDKQLAQCRTTSASEAAAKARVNTASQTLSDGTVRAPFAGLVGERFVTIGDYVHEDTRVVTLLADDTLRIKLTVPEPYLAFAKEGLVVSFRTVSFPNETFAATIRYLGQEVRQNTRDLVVEAVIANDKRLLPGMFVNVDMPTGEQTLPVIPKKALLTSDSGTTVFAIVDQKLQQRAVQVGPPAGEDVGIRVGVAKGDRLMLNPTSTTPDGAVVE